MEVPPGGSPRQILSEEEWEKLEQQIQKEEERMREEKENRIPRPRTLTEEQRILRRLIWNRAYKAKRKAAYEKYRQEAGAQRQSDDGTETFTGWIQKQTLSEEEQRIRAEREQRIQEEGNLMREEQNHAKGLTDEQRKIRDLIRKRQRRLRLGMERDATDEKYRQKRAARRQKDEEKRILREEKQRLKAEREQRIQEEENLMREEQHIPRAKKQKLTDEQRKIRKLIYSRKRHHPLLRTEREAR
ncbi:hypothetical protein MMC22_010221 [Lobaria immixta]|nr:hypothetical protein [Lobaria immixta]